MSDQRCVSRRLYEVLEEVGASETIRQLHQQSAAVIELSLAMRINTDHELMSNLHLCGSRFEGSVTPDLASDMDIILCHLKPPVVLNPACIPHGLACVVVLDLWTYPGYIKLQVVKDGRRLTDDDDRVSIEDAKYDAVGRLCVEHVVYGNMHGPAVMSIGHDGKHYQDTVFSLKCDNIPCYAQGWLVRQRTHGWPTPEHLETMSRMGCMFVGVGHWESGERDLERRMSFSLQERLLMSSLNSVQHKVYIVLKMIKKNNLGKIVANDFITSYHCKASLFHAIEGTPADFWTSDNLINCILYCLKLLLQWTEDSYFPNYFIMEQNLFSKKGFMRVRDKLISVLRILIQSQHHFLYYLENDNIRDMMRGGDLLMIKPVIEARKYSYIYTLNEQVIYNNYKTFYLIVHKSKDFACTLGKLQSTDSINGRSIHDTQRTMELLQPWCHLHIALTLAGRAVGTDDRHSADILLRRADEHLCCTSNTDVSSVRFARATILYTSGKHEACRTLLQEIERDLTFQVLSFCPCRNTTVYNVNDEQQYRDLKDLVSQMPVSSIIQHHLASCVVFLRSESRVVPTALQYEMYRSLDTVHESRDESKDFWFDFAVVDARVYLYFMQYLVYDALHMTVHKQVAVDNIKAEIERCNAFTIRNGRHILNHKDTAYNLLGWIYLQQNRLPEAIHCFTESLQIRPDHNAAKFHLRDLHITLQFTGLDLSPTEPLT